MTRRPAAERARSAAAAVGSLLFAAMFLLFVYKIVMRYAFGDAVAWADELCIVLFIWTVFWSCALSMRERQQITFNLVVDALPASWRRGAAIFRALAVGGLFAAAAPTIFDYLGFLTRMRLPVLQWPLGYVYGCFGLLAAAVVIRSILGLIAACRGQDEI